MSEPKPLALRITQILLSGVGLAAIIAINLISHTFWAGLIVIAASLAGYTNGLIDGDF